MLFGKQIKSALKNRRGATFFMMIFVAITIFVFVLAIVEITKVFSIKYTVETNLRRDINNALEYNISDEHRKDGIIHLNTSDAKQDFKSNFHFYTGTSTASNSVYDPNDGIIKGCKIADDGTFLYLIHITGLYAQNHQATNTASMGCSGMIYIAPSIGGLEDVLFKIPINLNSTNFRVD